MLFLLILMPLLATAQAPRELQRIYFNLYTDSLKPVLNYYVNVEGRYKGDRFLPLDTNTIILTCSRGTLHGMEWVIPKAIDFPSVTFYAVAKSNPALHDSVTVFIQKSKDPEDDEIMRK